MKYYPVFIPTLNRYDHFKQCVESLSRNTHADKTELIIGLDYPPSEKYVVGYNKIKEYLPTIRGFKKVTIFERPENYGPGKNWGELQKYAFDHYDAAIASEDDNVFSPCFLDFMNKALEYFWDDNRVRSVSGYLGPQFYGKLKTPLLFSFDNNAWGLGLWKHKDIDSDISDINIFKDILFSFSTSWKVFKASPAIFLLLIGMVKSEKKWGDVSWSTLNIINNTYQLRPSFSFVRNIGHDGSGLNCSDCDVFLQNQVISDEKNFNESFSSVTNIKDNVVKHLLFNHLMPNGVLKKIRFLLGIIHLYLSFRRDSFK